MIILIGYMGSGKSTVAKILAELLQKPSYDLDALIEKKEGRTISKIFEEKGEVFFRKKERQTLENVLRENPDIILSLGGGTPCFGNNMELITKSTSHVFYLKPSITVLTKRLYLEKDKRPLISHLETEEKLEEFIGKHLFERNFYYLQAQHTIAADGKTPEAISKEIMALL